MSDSDGNVFEEPLKSSLLRGEG